MCTFQGFRSRGPHSFKLGLLLAIGIVGASGVGCAPRALVAPIPSAELESLATDHGLDRSWIGVRVVDGEGRILYDVNGNKLFTPASNMKVVTTALALGVLGPDYRWHTRVLRDSTGALYLVGGGDPVLTSTDLSQMADEVAIRLGTDSVPALWIVPAVFDSVELGPGWMWDDTPYAFSAPVSGLNVDHNLIRGLRNTATSQVVLWPSVPNLQVRVESAVPYPIFRPPDTLLLPPPSAPEGIEGFTAVVQRPEQWAGQLFRARLVGLGVHVPVPRIRWTLPDSGMAIETLAVHASPTLREVLYRLLKVSDNLYAEVFLKTLALETYGPPGTWAKGVAAAESVLVTWGLDTSQIRMADGSGLSRYNQVTPAFLTQLLLYARQQPWFWDYVVSFPVTGQDGTLRRMTYGFPGRIRAKSGTMTGVRNLCGYIFTDQGEVLVFSFMTNHYKGSRRKVDAFYGDLFLRLFGGRALPLPGGTGG